MLVLSWHLMPLLAIVIAVEALQPASHTVEIKTPSSEKSVIVKSKDPVSIRMKADSTEKPVHIHFKHSAHISSIDSKSSSSEDHTLKPKYHLAINHESSESDSFLKNRDSSSSSSSKSIYKKKKSTGRIIYLQYPKMTKHKVVIATKKYKPIKKNSKSYKKLNKNQNIDSSSDKSSSPSSSSTSSSSSSSSSSQNTSKRFTKKRKLNFIILNKKSRFAKDKIRHDKIAHKNIKNELSSSSSESHSSSSSSTSSSSDENNPKKKSLKGKFAIIPVVSKTNFRKTPKHVHGFVHYQGNNNGKVQNGLYAILKDQPPNGSRTHYNIQHNVYGQGGKWASSNPKAFVEAELRKLKAEYPWLNL